MHLSENFFNQETTLIAKSLIGKLITVNNKLGIITETEAYKGKEDPASHAFKKKTERNYPMFGPAGKSYVYFIYGLHYCFNITSGDTPGAVLIRGCITMCDKKIVINGPGKFCKYFNITKEQNDIDLTNNALGNCVQDIGIKAYIKQSSRIGISKGKDKYWRYFCSNIDNLIKQLK